LTFNFVITPCPYGEGEWVVNLEEMFRYTNNLITPKPVIVVNGITLIENVDYTLSYAKNQGITHRYENGEWFAEVEEENLPTISIAFAGNYSGNTSKTFKIGKVEITAEDIEVSLKSDVFYSGKETKLTIDNLIITLKETNGSPAYEITIADVVITNSATLVSGVETNNKDVGYGAVKLVFGGPNGTYTGTVIYDYEIKKLDISSDLVLKDESLFASVVYDSFAKTKDFENKLVVGETTLIQDTDFIVSYSSNTDVGKAIITLIGMNNLTGTTQIFFDITAKYFDTESFVVADIEDKVYNYGQEIKVDDSIVITYTKEDGSTTTLANLTDFYVESYRDNINIGVATIIIKGTGNFAGEIIKTFTIISKEITTSNIAFVNSQNRVFTGEAITLGQFEISVDGKETIIVSDEGAEYESNVNKGIATIKFNLTGNYTGSDLTLTFTITERQYNGSTFTVPNIRTQVKTGEEIKPIYAEPYTNGPIVYTNENGTPITLIDGTDYVLTYSNNIDYGMAYVNIFFRGNYTGTLTRSFTIDKATPTMDQFNAITYHVVDKNATELSNARYGEVETLADLIFVGDDLTPIDSLTWANANIAIANAGQVSAYVKFNPNPDLYNTLNVLITFNID
ncbi:MAG: hypothetical protein IKA31_00920, partial [Clostridia bacterium]|nr:hypothetical protein [Clostridia bacterium]